MERIAQLIHAVDGSAVWRHESIELFQKLVSERKLRENCNVAYAYAIVAWASRYCEGDTSRSLREVLSSLKDDAIKPSDVQRAFGRILKWAREPGLASQSRAIIRPCVNRIMERMCRKFNIAESLSSQIQDFLNLQGNNEGLLGHVPDTVAAGMLWATIKVTKYEFEYGIDYVARETCVSKATIENISRLLTQDAEFLQHFCGNNVKEETMDFATGNYQPTLFPQYISAKGQLQGQSWLSEVKVQENSRPEIGFVTPKGYHKFSWEMENSVECYYPEAEAKKSASSLELIMDRDLSEEYAVRPWMHYPSKLELQDRYGDF